MVMVSLTTGDHTWWMNSDRIVSVDKVDRPGELNGKTEIITDLPTYQPDPNDPQEVDYLTYVVDTAVEDVIGQINGKPHLP